MTAHTNNPRPERRHAAQGPYAEFYDDDAAETAAWLNGAEWARDPEQIERASCSVCDNPIADEPVECADWLGRWHHTECVRDCVECKGAALSERKRW